MTYQISFRIQAGDDDAAYNDWVESRSANRYAEVIPSGYICPCASFQFSQCLIEALDVVILLSSLWQRKIQTRP